MTPKKKEQTRGQCISTICMVNVFLLIANIMFPLPTGIGPALGAIVIVDLCAFPIIFATKKPAVSAGSAYKDSQTTVTPSKPRVLCGNCHAFVDHDKESCHNCGYSMNHSE